MRRGQWGSRAEREKEQPELRLGAGKGARRCLTGALGITCLRGRINPVEGMIDFDIQLWL